MVVLFESVTLDHVVLGLLNDWLVPPILLTDTDGSHDTGRWPLRSAPVEGETLLDNVMHRCAGLLELSLIVRPMRKHNINIVQLESLQRVLNAFDDVLTRHESVVNTRRCALPQLGCDDDRLTPHVEILKGLAHLGLCLAHTIDFGGVEEINSHAEALFDGISGEIKSLLVIGIEPVAVAEYGNLEPSATQVSVDHLGVVWLEALGLLVVGNHLELC